MTSRIVRLSVALAAAALLGACDTAVPVEPDGPSAADRRACQAVRGTPAEPVYPTGTLHDKEQGALFSAEEVYQQRMQVYDAEMREILGRVNNAEDERLRGQITVEGAAVRCRDLGL